MSMQLRSSTPLRLLSLFRFSVGVGAFIAPGTFLAHAYDIHVPNVSSAVNDKAIARTKIPVRLFAGRDFILGLLLLNPVADVVTAGLQVAAVVDSIDAIISCLAYADNAISVKSALISGGVASVMALSQIWLSRSV